MHAPRRKFLRLAGACCLLNGFLPVSSLAAGLAEEHALAANQHAGKLLAAWQLPDSSGQLVYQAGVLQVLPDSREIFRVVFSVDLPSRPHGLMHLHEQEYLVVARRPGDWLMKLNLATGAASRLWQQESSRLNGHSVSNAVHVFTTETDLLTGEGMLAIRDRSSLQTLDVWPTHGHDPHEVVSLPAGALGIGQPFLLVANGGIKTHADMGRTRLLTERMDSSVVALHPSTGRLLKKWTLNDGELSLRHLAFHPLGVLAVALQAQHLDAGRRNDAPVLALLGNTGLEAVLSGTGEQGYAGDVVATRHGFAVSCTRSNRLLQFSLAGELLSASPAPAACALAASGNRLWAGMKPGPQPLEIDNHWLLLEG